MKNALCLIFICLIMLGCHTSNGKKKNTAKKIGDKKILTRAIVFKVASNIQNRYLNKYKDTFKNENGKLLRFLNGTALSKKNITKQEIPPFLTPLYRECTNKIINSDKSYWTIKAILDHYDIPKHISNEGDVLFNPYIYLPDSIDPGTLNHEWDFFTLWDLFYTAILLDEKPMLEKAYPILIKKVTEEYPNDLPFFKNIYRISIGESTQLYDAQSLSCHYLLTGNLDNMLRLSDADSKRLREVIAYYDQHYYHSAYISVNAFTLENRTFMWLAAREREQAGDINKANVYIKTTFDNEVLRNVKQFHPNHQVYLYATIRIALQMHSPKMYRYVYGALDPLTKLKNQPFKELLKMQLLQLIN